MKVDARSVEQELARLQRELTNSEVRTSLFNLVVMSPDAERAMVDEALNELLGKRAARVIHIVNKPDAASDLHVSARCFVDHEHKGVCFEEVVITNGIDGAGGAPGSWIPLLVRDIPTHIVWLDTLTDKTELFSHVRTQADKVIVDSDHCVGLGDEEPRLLRLLATETVSEGVPMADFSWKRLRPYRRLVAGAFEGEEQAGWPAEISRVEVAGMEPASARLFGLWFAERLGWTPARRHGEPTGPADEYADLTAAGTPQTGESGDATAGTKTVHRYRDPRGRDVIVASSRGASGCDVGITIALADGRSIGIETSHSGCADVEYPGGSAERVVNIPTNGEILLEEVDAVYADDLYRDALSLALENGRSRSAIFAGSRARPS